MHSWNVSGIRLQDFDNFVRELDGEISWGVLLLQEFSGAIQIKEFEDKVRHGVYVAPPTEGSRATCIIVHESIRHWMVHETQVTGPTEARHLATGYSHHRTRMPGPGWWTLCMTSVSPVWPP